MSSHLTLEQAAENLRVAKRADEAPAENKPQLVVYGGRELSLVTETNTDPVTRAVMNTLQRIGALYSYDQATVEALVRASEELLAAKGLQLQGAAAPAEKKKEAKEPSLNELLAEVGQLRQVVDALNFKPADLSGVEQRLAALEAKAEAAPVPVTEEGLQPLVKAFRDSNRTVKQGMDQICELTTAALERRAIRRMDTKGATSPRGETEEAEGEERRHRRRHRSERAHSEQKGTPELPEAPETPKAEE